MIVLTIVVGTLVIILGLSILISPGFISNYLITNSNHWHIYALAVFSRILIGLLLIGLASQSAFPLVIRTLGIAAIVGAVFLLYIGREKFSKMLLWLFEIARPIIRVGGLLGIVFGVFIIYAFV